ncbi:C-C motif chemokine 19 [Xenopus laevis]|uniref:C-C motif chemokine n=2 Tax=Xenopus laevis TaxID=8355 RepID=A0A1L8I3Q5_XENLA|nr:C-C motif chemokine 19 [Xenopus laevis]XP_041426287.1 C-C motif chemokine 19 [Xenopus laevis]OCU02758.1 hypothetical protein XELAEV_18008527mg [Xenopus laevis]BDV32437.1 C-C motif chemokine ligand 21.L [Xenopus laevis]
MRPIWTLLPLAVLVVLLCDTVYMQGTGNIVADCCLRTSDKRIPLGAVRAYQIQSQNNGCPKNAVVFITKTNKQLCSTQGLKWVNKLMQKLDKLGKKSGKKKNTARGAGERRNRGDPPTHG